MTEMTGKNCQITKRGGWNKRGGWKIFIKSINMEGGFFLRRVEFFKIGKRGLHVYQRDEHLSTYLHIQILLSLGNSIIISLFHVAQDIKCHKPCKCCCAGEYGPKVCACDSKCGYSKHSQCKFKEYSNPCKANCAGEVRTFEKTTSTQYFHYEIFTV